MDGSHPLTRPVSDKADPTNEARHDPANVLAEMRRLGWDLRDFTADELTVFTAARQAGASFPSRYIAEYLKGERACPYQFEGCWHGAERSWADEQIDANIARRDAFLSRIDLGDLRDVAGRVFGGVSAERVAA